MKNIRLAYWITALIYSWFWLGIWILYYKDFGGYTAVGILEAVMVITAIVAEIPTGAIGDLLGKRKTIILAALFLTVAQIWMGIAPNLLNMILSLITLNLGYALLSGTFEAMIYDTLKENNREEEYDRVIGNVTAITYMSYAICGVIGGYMYQVSPGLPFIMNGLGMFIAFLLAFSIKEPEIDTERFTFFTYIKQNIEGAKHLFRTNYLGKITLGLLLIALILIVMDEGYNSILMADYGFSDKELGIASAIFALCGAIGSVWAGRMKSKRSLRNLLLIAVGFYVISLLLSPFVGMIAGAGLVLSRFILQPIIENRTSGILNRNIESKYRATSLSTFSMISKIPYALSVFFLTSLADRVASTTIALGLGVVLFIGLIINLLIKERVTLPKVAVKVGV